MSKETTTVKILGASYKIACPPEESEDLKKAANFLDERLSEVKEASGLDEKRAAIITALNISNEYIFLYIFLMDQILSFELWG